MTQRVKHYLIAIVTFIGGLYFFLEFLLPEKIGSFEFGAYHDQISTGVQILGTMAIGMGIINLLKVHGGKLLHVRAGWVNSLALLFGLTFTIVVESWEISRAQSAGSDTKAISALSIYFDTQTKSQTFNESSLSLLKESFTKHEKKFIAQSAEASKLPDNDERKRTWANAATVFAQAEQAIEDAHALLNNQHELKDTQQLQSLQVALESLTPAYQQFLTARHEHSTPQVISRFIFSALFVPLGSAMFSLLAFYIANAAYRSFRIRSKETVVMMVASLIVMLGQIPHGPLYISEDLPYWRLWLLQNVSTPAFRAIYFGSAIAGLAMAVRMWLSLERSPLDEEAVKDHSRGSGV